MSECSFCGKPVQKGTGMIYVKKDGRILYFCKRKCEKNLLELKRSAKNLQWTKEGRKQKAERLKALKK